MPFFSLTAAFRQLHLQMEGLDRPKVGEWRDTKGFYGASIPLAWAQAWTT